jgi:predicted ATPase/DNA-binding CsgD family transcriptional regulator
MSAHPETTGNLPSPLTSLVGRRPELREAEALLRDARLLTLTGPGGSGKTRLALALAERLAPTMPGGAWWVGLEGVEDETLVAQAAVSGLGAEQLNVPRPVDAVASWLGSEPALLVLDNCEQIVDGCSELASALMARCPDLRIITTSRLPLGAPDEQLFRLRGLTIGSDGEGAVDLFVARARRHVPSFPDDPATLSAVARICELLDGMPLAIELAAARTPMLTAGEIASRLDDDARLLQSRSSAIPARHRSLEATLDWSHRLLDGDQQTVFRRLAVFRGSFDLEATEVVAAGHGIDSADVVEALAGLVDHSLVDVIRTPGGTRYRLLLIVRQYAGLLLDRAGETTQVRDRHLRHFSAVVSRGAEELMGGDQAATMARFDAEHDNLRAALGFALGSDTEAAAQLVSGLWRYWHRRGLLQEGQHWLEKVISVSTEAPARVIAPVMFAAAAFAMLRNDYPLATRRSQQSLALYRELDDQSGIALTMHRLGSIASEQGHYDRAVELHERALGIWQRLGDDDGIAYASNYLGFVLWLSGDFDRAEPFAEQAHAMYSEQGSMQEVVAAKTHLGTIAYYKGDDVRAAALLDESIEIARRLNHPEELAYALHHRALVAADNHQLVASAQMLSEALRRHWQLGDQWRTARVIEDIAGLLLIRAEPALAGRLLASAEQTRERLSTPVPAAERPAQERYVAALERTLSSDELESRRAEGHELELGAAVEEAQHAVERLYLRGAGPQLRADDLLTPREAEVLRLLARGHTNREIGAALFISQATAGVHVSGILRKLSVRSRAEAVTRAHELGLLEAD